MTPFLCHRLVQIPTQHYPTHILEKNKYFYVIGSKILLHLLSFHTYPKTWFSLVIGSKILLYLSNPKSSPYKYNNPNPCSPAMQSTPACPKHALVLFPTSLQTLIHFCHIIILKIHLSQSSCLVFKIFPSHYNMLFPSSSSINQSISFQLNQGKIMFVIIVHACLIACVCFSFICICHGLYNISQRINKCKKISKCRHVFQTFKHHT